MLYSEAEAIIIIYRIIQYMNHLWRKRTMHATNSNES